jgi:hypothetical protein
LTAVQQDVARIYKLVDSLPSKMVYIGRTIKPLEARRKQHLSNAWRGNKAPVYQWLRTVLQERREPLIVELECVPVEQAAAAEDAWIARERANGSTVLNERSGASGSFSRAIFQQRYTPNCGGRGYRGVQKSGKTKWRALLRHKGIYQHLGTYTTAEEAARAYDKAAIALFGETALLNFPGEHKPGRLPPV